jgi:hypothetical protein
MTLIVTMVFPALAIAFMYVARLLPLLVSVVHGPRALIVLLDRAAVVCGLVAAGWCCRRIWPRKTVTE